MEEVAKRGCCSLVGYQRGTDVFDPEFSLRGSPCLRIRRHEHRLNPSRRADRQHAAISVATVPEGVDGPAGDVDERSCRSLDPSLTHLERVLPLPHVKASSKRCLWSSGPPASPAGLRLS